MLQKDRTGRSDSIAPTILQTVAQKSFAYISPISREAPVGGFAPDLARVGMAEFDINICEWQFCGDRLRDVDSAGGGQICPCHWQVQSPLSQRWRYRAVRDVGLLLKTETSNSVQQCSLLHYNDDWFFPLDMVWIEINWPSGWQNTIWIGKEPEILVKNFLPRPSLVRPNWTVRGKTIRSVLCNIVCNNCAQCDAHTYEQTNSSLDWVLSHWAHFTVLDSFLYCVLLCVVCMIA